MATAVRTITIIHAQWSMQFSILVAFANLNWQYWLVSKPAEKNLLSIGNVFGS